LEVDAKLEQSSGKLVPVYLDAETCRTENGGETGTTHGVVAASVERLLGIDVAQDLAVVNRVAINGIVVVEPSVHRAPRMTINDGLVSTVQDILEVTNLERCRSFTVITIREANVHRSSWPQEALFGGTVLSGIMGFCCSHATDIEILEL